MTENVIADSHRNRFISELCAYYLECGSPVYGRLVDISQDLHVIYRDPHGPPPRKNDLPTLSRSGISEVLHGKRKGLPSSRFVASFVLSCNYERWNTRGDCSIDRSILLPWQVRLQLARMAAEPNTSAPRPPSAPAATEGRVAMPSRWLPSAEHAFISGQGPEGRAILAGLRDGEADACYRAGLLLVSEPDFTQTGMTLLLDAAGSSHEAALEVLDAGRVDPALLNCHTGELAHPAR